MGARWRTPIGGGQGRYPCFPVASSSRTTDFVLPIALIFSEDWGGVDRQTIWWINNDLDIADGQLVFAGRHLAVAVFFGRADPAVKLIDAGLQLAVAANTLNGYAAGAGAGAIIFHDEVVLNRWTNVHFLSRLHHFLYLRLTLLHPLKCSIG